MAGEWPVARVSDLADSISETHKFGKDHLIFLNTSDVLMGKILHHSYSAVKDWPGQAKKSIRKDDILFSEIRPANGRYAFVDIQADDYVVSTKLMVIRAKKDWVIPRFLYRFLTSKETTAWLQHLAESRSGTFPQITFDQVAELELPLPPKTHQAAIAAFFDTIDDKIEINRKMNETLEAMARAIFKSWFIDFDPIPGHGPHREWENSPLGRIPKGWEVKALPEIIDINPPRSLGKGEETSYVDMKNMPTQGHRPSAWITRPFGSGMKFVNGDTLLARITPCLENGKTAFVDFLSEGQVGWGSTEYIVLRPKTPLPDYYGYLLARDERLRDFAIGNMTGSSGRQRVPADCFPNFLIVAPPKEIAEVFGKMISGFQTAIKVKDEESATLTALRDALLPKLLSGEIMVKDAERFTHTAVTPEVKRV